MRMGHMMMVDTRSTGRRYFSNRNFDHYGFSSTGKLHLCNKNGLTKCGATRIYLPIYESEPSSFNKCRRCYYIPSPKKPKSEYTELIDKDVKTWCGRIGIKL